MRGQTLYDYSQYKISSVLERAKGQDSYEINMGDRNYIRAMPLVHIPVHTLRHSSESSRAGFSIARRYIRHSSDPNVLVYIS